MATAKRLFKNEDGTLKGPSYAVWEVMNTGQEKTARQVANILEPIGYNPGTIMAEVGNFATQGLFTKEGTGVSKDPYKYRMVPKTPAPEAGSYRKINRMKAADKIKAKHAEAAAAKEALITPPVNHQMAAALVNAGIAASAPVNSTPKVIDELDQDASLSALLRRHQEMASEVEQALATGDQKVVLEVLKRQHNVK